MDFKKKIGYSGMTRNFYEFSKWKLPKPLKPSYKVEPLITDNLSNYSMTWSSARQNKYFQRCIDRNNENCKKIGNFII